MHRVALIYNPASGQHPQRKAALITAVVAMLRSAAIEVKVIPTESAESVGTEAQEAIREGCDTILACGGDGTVHDVLQERGGNILGAGCNSSGHSKCFGGGPWFAGISEEGCEDVAYRYSGTVSVASCR